MDQTRDQILLLEDIRQRLERLENQQWEQAIGKIDLGQFAIDLRRARVGVFPDEYCTGNIWDVLLELYEAKRSGAKLRLSEISEKAKISEKLVLRYIDLLSADGFLYHEQHIGDEPYILLTDKAMTKIAQLFEYIRVGIDKPVGLRGVADNDMTVSNKVSAGLG